MRNYQYKHFCKFDKNYAIGKKLFKNNREKKTSISM